MSKFLETCSYLLLVLSFPYYFIPNGSVSFIFHSNSGLIHIYNNSSTPSVLRYITSLLSLSRKNSRFGIRVGQLSLSVTKFIKNINNISKSRDCIIEICLAILY